MARNHNDFVDIVKAIHYTLTTHIYFTVVLCPFTILLFSPIS